jgi:dolichol-phosphate mannosyltransferase
MKKNNRFHILIPVFNENETIVETVRNILQNVDYNFEILICYDFDEDKTLNILKENFKNNPKIKYIKNKSRGFNLALITGIEISDADAILIYMADDHNNSKLINRIFEKYNEGYHVVCPSRFVQSGNMKGVPFLKGVLTKLASFIIFNFSTFPIKDATNSFRLFSRELLSQLTLESNKGFTLSFEITAKAHRLNFKMIEIPTVWIERTRGESRFKLLTFIPLYLRWLFYIFQTTLTKKN